MMSAWLKMTSVAAILLAVVAMGCGGDDGSSSDATSSSGSASTEGDSSSVSNAEFVEQANAACRQEQTGATAKAALYIKTHRSQGLPQETLSSRAFNVAILSTVEAELDALHELPQAAEEEELEAMLASKEAALRKAKKIELKAELPEIVALFKPANKEAQSLGLTKCIVIG
jgi:hypothetical protein